MPSYKIKKGFIVQKSKKGTVIFDSETSMLYSFNPTGNFILDKLKKGKSVETIISQMVKQFNVPLKKAQTDLHEFILILISKGLAEEIVEK